MTALLLLLALVAKPADPRAALEEKFRAIAATAGGTVGVSVLDLETGRGASLHGNERFPMASVFKLAVAVELLSRADRGAVRLDQSIALAPADMRPGGPLSERAPNGGITLTFGELLEAMIVDGDNTAADVLLPLAGGPEVVTAQLDAVGLGDIRVDRSELELAFDVAGVATAPPRSTRSLAAIRAAIAAVPEAAHREALREVPRRSARHGDAECARPAAAPDPGRAPAHAGQPRAAARAHDPHAPRRRHA